MGWGRGRGSQPRSHSITGGSCWQQSKNIPYHLRGWEAKFSCPWGWVPWRCWVPRKTSKGELATLKAKLDVYFSEGGFVCTRSYFSKITSDSLSPFISIIPILIQSPPLLLSLLKIKTWNVQWMLSCHIRSMKRIYTLLNVTWLVENKQETAFRHQAHGGKSAQCPSLT